MVNTNPGARPPGREDVMQEAWSRQTATAALTADATALAAAEPPSVAPH